MLSKQLDDTPDTAEQRGIKAISRRVSTLAQVYDHLLGNEMTRTTDFGSYVKSLCLNLAESQAAPDGYVTLTCDREAIVLDLDVVTALGIVVAEVVTNSYDHAFPRGKRGSIIMSVRRAEGDADRDHDHQRRRSGFPGQSREQTARSWAGATTCRTGARKRGRQL